ncbi:hypothetical protein Amsp01_101310 [Amycolatopsis sp. NBRC 101858]|uniref:hypothetical protein n=1 Tax=Amycolatopsis sp. NBRC 101858 TaxID=3032200 RepID=UPI0024A532F9|nr:hypothetical protein [Amycolatopsis sp. NBRC 101858]GLY44108.1 hypothetical protein Amsp01_101310 [Amycolatopsis sp. NBRC 101858]
MHKWGKYFAAAVLAGAALAAAPATAVAAEGCQWSSSALPVPGGYWLEDVGGGDGAGTVAGTLRPGSPDQPRVGVLWRADELHVAGAAFGQDTELDDVNAAGVAVGSYSAPHVFGVPDLHHAVRYAGGTFERLPDPPGYTNTVALAVNARGDILGAVGESASTGVYASVVWPADAPGTVDVLPVPSPGWQVQAGIADDGTVAAAAFDWSAGGDLAGYVLPERGAAVRMASPVPTGDVVPTAITTQRIAGYAGESGAFLWHLDGSVDRALPGLQNVAAMNSAGAIAGYANGGATLFLPADGSPAQTVAPSGEDTRVREVTESGDLFGTATTPEHVVVPTHWHCG